MPDGIIALLDNHGTHALDEIGAADDGAGDAIFHCHIVGEAGLGRAFDQLAQRDLDELVAWVSADPAANAIQLDLEACTIESDPEKERKVFSVDPTARDMLLKGLDEIGLTEQSMDLVSRFEERDQAQRPWVYLASD